ncbi:MAG TPA: hypothetical protein VGR71_16770 [Nitrospira sp.]|nr:hypothetical protein [Nitrospira sp.]
MASTVTSKVERKNGGMPNWCVLGVGVNHEGKLVCYWPYTSEIDGERFLTRFIVVRTPLASVDVTRIHMPDDQRKFPHDHSRTFWSFKFGWYAEDVFYDKADLSLTRHVRHRRLGVHRLKYTQAHSITEVSPKLVTVLFLGPRRQKSNYWTPNGLQSIGMGVDQDEWE